uniref:Uncharacterized protein n=1 Tax=Chenopodium quinoa TaxID=63459 RepID=A0A803MQJ3_CHEQI
MKNSVFLVIEELMMKLKEVAKVGEMVSIKVYCDVIDLMYENDEISRIFVESSVYLVAAVYAMTMPKQRCEFSMVGWVNFFKLLGFVNWVWECEGVRAGDAVRWRAASYDWWMVVEIVMALWGRELKWCCVGSIDPLFFYLPIVEHQKNFLGMDYGLAVTTTTLRTMIDAFYLIYMAFQFRTAYNAPSSQVFGRGELMINTEEIARSYVLRYFIIDLLAVLPLPQV